jgi:hypothetical protein
MDLKVLNLILNKNFDSKTIKHFITKQETSLFRRKKYAKFFFKHPMSYLKKYLDYYIINKKFSKKKQKKDGQTWLDVTRCGHLWSDLVICDHMWLKI